MIRIRYNKSISNVLTSGPFKTADNELSVEIQPTGMVIIYNKTGGILYNDTTMASSIKSRTIPNAKKFAKKALQSLGLVIESEVRPRIKNNEGKETKKEVLQLYQDSIMDDET